MIKFLFFDYRETERLANFRRELQQPAKQPGPLFVADQPWEFGNMQLYGSVLRRPDGLYQLWYSTIQAPWRMYLGYAVSDDGLSWRRELQDFYRFEGRRTNILLDVDIHGPAVIHDPHDPRPDWRYKMLCGAEPFRCICGYRSADGVAWHPVRQGSAIPTPPDCPIGFLRTQDGRYVAYHRLMPLGRRICRSESWDFSFWSGEPRLVLEPGPPDHPQTQFYGLGAVGYGAYELGTLWMYHTRDEDAETSKMRGYQEAELTYSRSGYAWHRAEAGVPFLAHGGPEDWDRGNLQCASQPVFLPEEIRYYFMGTDRCHSRHWELEPQTAGLGLATLPPDRFVALVAEEQEADWLSYPFRLGGPEVFVNAQVAPGGSLQVGLVSADLQPCPGLGLLEAEPVCGDVLREPVRWRGAPDSLPLGQWVRLQVRACQAKLYSLAVGTADEAAEYWRFDLPRP